MVAQLERMRRAIAKRKRGVTEERRKGGKEKQEDKIAGLSMCLSSIIIQVSSLRSQLECWNNGILE